MLFKNLRVLVLWTKVASALEGLRQGHTKEGIWDQLQKDHSEKYPSFCKVAYGVNFLHSDFPDLLLLTI